MSKLVDLSELGGPRAAPPVVPSNAALPRPVAPPTRIGDQPAASPQQRPRRWQARRRHLPLTQPPRRCRAIPEDKKAASAPSKKETAAPPAPTETLSPSSAAPPGSTASPPAEAGKTKTSPKLSLQLELPPNFVAPSGLSTAAVRPPDITRSGESDEFGRRVIRALRQTYAACARGGWQGYGALAADGNR